MLSLSVWKVHSPKVALSIEKDCWLRSRTCVASVVTANGKNDRTTFDNDGEN
ncbi:MAG: hypothetical protein IPM42_21685 [Saprospiraceae bacterium]|nr:hypothetical protein [Saprospiraceae bacterium]